MPLDPISNDLEARITDEGGHHILLDVRISCATTP